MDKQSRITAVLPRILVVEAKHAAIDREVDLCDLIEEGLRMVLAKKPKEPDEGADK